MHETSCLNRSIYFYRVYPGVQYYFARLLRSFRYWTWYIDILIVTARYMLELWWSWYHMATGLHLNSKCHCHSAIIINWTINSVWWISRCLNSAAIWEAALLHYNKLRKKRRRQSTQSPVRDLVCHLLQLYIYIYEYLYFFSNVWPFSPSLQYE